MFTPGPWKIGFKDGSGSGENGECFWITDNEDKVVITGGKNGYGVPIGIKDNANANLIVAAPNMYKALKLALEGYEVRDWITPHGSMKQIVENALALAEGGDKP